MAQEVMKDKTWKFAIDYVGKDKTTSTSEAVSNGIWNEVLRRLFPFPKFIIAPEQRQTTGKRPDLTIFFVDQAKKEWHPVFTLEGKAPYHINTDLKVENGIAQAAGYVPGLSWSNDEEYYTKQKFTYGMFACGKKFRILEYDVDKDKIKQLMASSLDDNATEFDDFCHNLAASFK
ncbi:hypothetical protein LIA77_03606 [Sarocladium implicatum]|nr:hypothetical protein LIA77_03606 [Sarocladium implicatum]